MTISEAVNELRQRDAIRLDDNAQLQVRLPDPIPPALEPAMEAIRRHRGEAVSLLQSSAWSPESLAAERKFRIPAAKLYPLLDHEVLTPAGAGVLVQVFSDRVQVHLKGEPRTREFRPEEIAVADDVLRPREGKKPC
jgi:hypothetical protein